MNGAVIADGDGVSLLGDRGKTQEMPSVTALQKPSCQIVLMQALLDENDDSRARVIEASYRRGLRPLVELICAA
jgi:hypothetical protein